MWCACDNAWIFSVTFTGHVGHGDVQPLITIGDELTGDGVALSETTTLVDAPVLNGTFALIHPLDPTKRTREIAVDSESRAVADALFLDLGLPVHDIHVTTNDLHGGRYWAITFADFDVPGLNGTNDNEIPLLLSDSSRLGYSGASAEARAGCGTRPGATAEPSTAFRSSRSAARRRGHLARRGRRRAERSKSCRRSATWRRRSNT